MAFRAVSPGQVVCDNSFWQSVNPYEGILLVRRTFANSHGRKPVVCRILSKKLRRGVCGRQSPRRGS